MKHWMAVHTFISDDARREYYASPNQRTEKEWAEHASALDDAKCRQTWAGTEDFFFCHGEADSEAAIHKA